MYAENWHGLCLEPLGTLCAQRHHIPSDLTGLSWAQKLRRHVVMAMMTGGPFSILRDNKGSMCPLFPPPPPLLLSSSPCPQKLKPRPESHIMQMNSRSVTAAVLSLPPSKGTGRLQKAAETWSLVRAERIEKKTWEEKKKKKYGIRRRNDQPSSIHSWLQVGKHHQHQPLCHQEKRG
ncbi:ninjurin-2 isoform X1 [Lacerta agilis]|uniref:ninjurin-2 isoform X1 n=1 Tax=Lacerta agilis TaxID=80427 RepID=UPI001419AC33|nr:ninjurin-2 isoform X1 [Lacerta agilis]